MSYSTLQKDLERISLKKDLDQALERMVNFEEEVNRNSNADEEEEEFEEDDEEEFEEEENSYNFVQLVKSYLFGVVVGFSLVSVCPYINGRNETSKATTADRKNNQR